MVDRLEMAKQIMREQLAERDDIVGVIVAGSVASGEDIDVSDIDLGIVTADKSGAARRSMSTWREGVYIDCALSSIEDWTDFDAVMKNPFKAANIKAALILHDSTGLLSKMQDRVRAVFMEPKWLTQRLEFWLKWGRENLAALRLASEKGDPVGVCLHSGKLVFSFCSIPLIRAGLAPSSSRMLAQLGELNPDLWERLVDFLGCADVDATIAEKILVLHGELCELSRGERWGGLVDYFPKKLRLMSERGQFTEMMDAAWRGWSMPPDTAVVKHKLDTVATEWLQTVGWEGEEFIKEKLKVAESLFSEVEALAADLSTTD